MKIFIYLLLMVSPSSNAPVEEYDAGDLRKSEDQVHSHTDVLREGKWTFNYAPGAITVESVRGDDFAIGHSAEIGIGESPSQVANQADQAEGSPANGLADPELLVCEHGPYPLREDCFCQNANGGVVCPRNSRCFNGVCHEIVRNPCSFDDNHLGLPEHLRCRPNDKECESSPHDRSRRFQWKDNKVPYIFTNENTKQEDKDYIKKVMDDIKERTCFEFIERTTETHHLEIEIKDDKTCLNNAGNVAPSGNLINLKLTLFTHVTDTNGKDCGQYGLLVHELMHVLGVGHTQRRVDRDNHIEVKLANLIKSFTSQYDICPISTCTLFEAIDYDCGSIMHYGTHDNGIRFKQVIVPKDPSKCKLKEFANLKFVQKASDVSAKDWELLNLIGEPTCTSKKRKRSVQDIKTIQGKILLPANSSFVFPENSHVLVSCNDISNLPSTILATAVMDVSNSSSQREIFYKLEANFEVSASISMLATINIGWERDPNDSEWIREGDYVNYVRHSLDETEDTSNYQVDIEVFLYN